MRNIWFKAQAVVSLLVLFLFCFVSCSYEYEVECPPSFRPEIHNIPSPLGADSFSLFDVSVNQPLTTPLHGGNWDISAQFSGLTDSMPDLFDELILASHGSDILISNIACIKEDNSSLPLNTKSYLKCEGSGDKVKIVLSDSIDSALITVTACNITENALNRTIGIKGNGITTVFGSNPLPLDGSYAYDPQDSLAEPVEVTVSVSVTSGEFIIANERSQYITGITVSANLKSDNFIEEYTLTEEGLLPDTASSIALTDRTYFFIGWVNSCYEPTDRFQPAPPDSYYAVYAAAEHAEIQILLTEPYALCFGFNLYFLDSRYIDGILKQAEGLSLYAVFSLPQSADTTFMPLKNYVIDNNVVKIQIAVFNIPAASFEENINTGVAVKFMTYYTYQSGFSTKSIASLAREYLSDISEVQTDKYYNPVWADIGGTHKEVFSRYSNSQLELLKAFTNI